jgi:hypothetical protein
MNRRKTAAGEAQQQMGRAVWRLSVAAALIAGASAVSVRAQAETASGCEIQVIESQRWGQKAGLPGYNQKLDIVNLGNEPIYNPTISITTAYTDQITGGWESFYLVETWSATFSKSTRQTTRTNAISLKSGNGGLIAQGRLAIGGFTLIGSADTPPTYTCTPGVASPPPNPNPNPNPLPAGQCAMEVTSEEWNGSESGTLSNGGYNLKFRVVNQTRSTIAPRLNIYIPPNQEVLSGWGELMGVSFGTTFPTTVGISSYFAELGAFASSEESGITVAYLNKTGAQAVPKPTYSCTVNPTTTVPTNPSTTVPSTTVPSTTVPSTTIPSATVPSTTIPSTTISSTTIPTSNPDGPCVVRVGDSNRWGQDGQTTIPGYKYKTIPGYNQKLIVVNLGTEPIYNPIITITTASKNQILSGWQSLYKIETWQQTYNADTDSYARTSALTGNPNVLVDPGSQTYIGGFTILGDDKTPPTYSCTNGVPQPAAPSATNCPFDVISEFWNGVYGWGGYNQKFILRAGISHNLDTEILTVTLPPGHRAYQSWGAFAGVDFPYSPGETTIQVPLSKLAASQSGFTVYFSDLQDPVPRPTYSCSNPTN